MRRNLWVGVPLPPVVIPLIIVDLALPEERRRDERFIEYSVPE
jgi:hypothetical protein